MNWLEREGYALHLEDVRLEPFSLENNIVGFCSLCKSELKSIAYYRQDSEWLVCARCQGEHLVLIQYDLDWNWLSDQDLQISAETKSISISTISRDKLEAVFTPAEIRDMEAFERGEPYTRQNLYRARAKYEKFEKLFGVRINL